MLTEMTLCHFLMACYALDQGLEAQPHLDAARRTNQQAAKSRGTLTPEIRQLGVDVALATIRAAKRPEDIKAETWDGALALLNPLMAGNTSDPSPYKLAARIYAQRALWAQRLGKPNGKDITQGLDMADKALAKDARLPEALLAKGLLYLTQALATKPGNERTDLARRAQEALESAFREDPMLEREHGKDLQEARGLR